MNRNWFTTGQGSIARTNDSNVTPSGKPNGSPTSTIGVRATAISGR
jgi:hypothetical protein